MQQLAHMYRLWSCRPLWLLGLWMGWCVSPLAPQVRAQMALHLTPRALFLPQSDMATRVPLEQALRDMEETYEVVFIYRLQHVRGKEVVPPSAASLSLEQRLGLLLQPHQLTYTQVRDRTYVIKPAESSSTRHDAPAAAPKRVTPLLRNTLPLPASPALDRHLPTQVSQALTIRGTVRHQGTGDPMAGVTVRVKGTTTGTFTGEDGSFRIEVPDLRAVLVFSFVGFEEQEVSLSAETLNQLEVRMVEKATVLDEVVVVGFSTQRKSDLTGAVVKVRTDDIPQIPVVNAAEALRGRAAGVLVSSGSGLPGRNPTIRIRGESSINASNEPLVVIDGAPGGDLASLNFNDVESFEVLKDAAATSIFGKQGANGVILITTKRGREGRSQVDFNMKNGFRYFPPEQPVLDGPQFYQYLKEVLPTMPVTFSDFYEANLREETLSRIDTNNLYNTNWQDEMFNPGRFQEYNLAFSSGTRLFSYRLSGSYVQDKGIIQPAEYNRYNLLINIDAQPVERLKINTNINYALTDRTGVIDGGLGWNGGVVNATLQYPPFLPARDPGTGIIFPNPLQPNVDSPIALATGRTNRNIGNSLNGYFKATLDLVKGLSLRTEWFGRVGFDRQRSFIDPSSTYIGRERQGEGIDQTSFSRSANIQNFVEYKATVGRHQINLLAGHTARYTAFEGMTVTGFNYAEDTVYLLNRAGAFEPPRENLALSRAFAGVGRLDYSFANRYLLQVNFRADGSDNFPVGNRWGYFPSASAGWKLSEERFMAGVHQIDLLKLRAGAGFTGNDDIGFAYLSVYNTNDRARYPIFGTEENLATFGRGLENRNIRWESTFESNLGIDLVAWNGRLEVNLDLYNRNSYDLLYTRPVSITSGSRSVADNLGQVRNRGLEVFLSSVNVQREHLRWSTDFNFAFNDNRVLDLGAGTEATRTGVTWIEQGYPLHALFGYQVDRLFQESDFDDNGRLQPDLPFQANAQPGDIKFVNVRDIDTDGDGIPDAAIRQDEDEVFLGYPFPPYTFGLTNRVQWRGFTLAVFVQGVYGNSIYNQTRVFTEGMSNIFNQSVVVLDRWTPEHTSTEIPRAILGDPNRNTRNSDRFVEDGSYLRLKDLMLSYDFPEAVRTRAKVKLMRVFVSGQNLLTFTRYSGFDPEVERVDNGTYPQVRSLIFGFNLSL